MRRIGGGPPVVVLHGGPGAHHDYLLPGFDALADGRELIYYDQRGGGRSAVSRDVPVGWTEQVADLEALRAEWGLERLTIAGYSWGGLLALLYALEFPRSGSSGWRWSPPLPPGARRGRSSSSGSASGTSPPSSRRARRALRESGLRERDPEAYQRRSSSSPWRPTSTIPRCARDLTPFRVTGRTQQEVWASLGDFDLRARLPTLRGIPSLVLHGESDPIPLEASRAIAALIGADLHPLPRCGHVPYVEAHEEFVRRGRRASCRA